MGTATSGPGGSRAYPCRNGDAAGWGHRTTSYSVVRYVLGIHVGADEFIILSFRLASDRLYGAEGRRGIARIRSPGPILLARLTRFTRHYNLHM